MLATSLVAFLALWQSSSASLGIQEFQRGDFAAARQHLQQAGADPEASAFLALSRVAMGECEAVLPELARQFSEEVFRSTRRLTGLALVQCQIAARRYPAAAPVIAQLETEYPKDADVLYLAASFHMKAWNDDIYRLYRNAAASFRVNQLSGEVFESQGRYPEAISEYRKGIQKNPKAVNLHYRLARALLMQSHDPAALDEARREFSAELALSPSDAVAEFQIAQIYETQQQHEQAAVHFERAAQLRPDFPEALVAVAKLRVAAKNYPEAISLLQSAIQLQPGAELAHYNLMLAYRNAGRTADAQAEKTILDNLQRPPEGEFTDFLKRLGEKAPVQ